MTVRFRVELLRTVEALQSIAGFARVFPVMSHEMQLIACLEAAQITLQLLKDVKKKCI